jgi:hypothetical protein
LEEEEEFKCKFHTMPLALGSILVGYPVPRAVCDLATIHVACASGITCFCKRHFASLGQVVMDIDMLFPGEAFGVDTVPLHKVHFSGGGLLQPPSGLRARLCFCRGFQLFRSVFEMVFSSKIRPSTLSLTDLDEGAWKVGIVGMSNAMFSCLSEERELCITKFEVA